MPAPFLTPEERDAVYEQVMTHLSGIGDFWLAVEQRDFDTAERLGREFADELHLVLDDLGCAGNGGTAVELNSPPGVLRRVFSRVRELAEEQKRVEDVERAELAEIGARNQLVLSACARVLAGVES